MQEYTYEKRIMGSNAAIAIVAKTHVEADAHAKRLLAYAADVEARFSRFIPESELSRLNRFRSLIVSPQFMEVFLAARSLYRRTSGVFNVLVDISRFGYDADIELVKGTHRTGAVTHPYAIDMEAIVVDEVSRRITLQEGQHLDFGGFLKGHTAEVMVREYTEGSSIVNLGGDLYTQGRDVDDVPFEFEVEDPYTGEAILSFPIENAALATSGSYRRHWHYNGVPFFHILDGSGMQNPDTQIHSATVIAPRGGDADAFATVALVLGVEEGARALDTEGFQYCFVLTDGRIHFSETFPQVTYRIPYVV